VEDQIVRMERWPDLIFAQDELNRLEDASRRNRPIRGGGDQREGDRVGIANYLSRQEERGDVLFIA
jgi:hypothetical protein